jgi:hypothetical protein
VETPFLLLLRRNKALIEDLIFPRAKVEGGSKGVDIAR